MHYILPLLATLLSATSAVPLKANGFNFDKVYSPGPIPYSNGATGGGLPDVTFTYENGGTTEPEGQKLLDKCLEDYSTGRFYDSWYGNECEGMGWNKGTSGGIDTYKCYQACAPSLHRGIMDGLKRVECTYRTGVKNKCWMGYAPL
ncbi:MAG: hypothetical protein Q9226_006335 [Calogaya cf. arnoldii]